MTAALRLAGRRVNRKRVQRLMRLEALGPTAKIHQRGVYRRVGSPGRAHQHGRLRALVGQRVRRAGVAQIEVRGGPSEGRRLSSGRPRAGPVANGLKARIGIGQWLRFYNDSRPHQALGYKTPAVTWAAEVSPVDLPLRLDDAGASPATSLGQQQQNVVFI